MKCNVVALFREIGSYPAHSCCYIRIGAGYRLVFYTGSASSVTKCADCSSVSVAGSVLSPMSSRKPSEMAMWAPCWMRTKVGKFIAILSAFSFYVAAFDTMMMMIESKYQCAPSDGSCEFLHLTGNGTDVENVYMSLFVSGYFDYVLHQGPISRRGRNCVD